MPGVQEPTPQVMDIHLRQVVRQLADRYADRAGSEEIEKQVFDEAAQYRSANVTKYIPVLVQHAVQERLRRRPKRGTQQLHLGQRRGAS